MKRIIRKWLGINDLEQSISDLQYELVRERNGILKLRTMEAQNRALIDRLSQQLSEQATMGVDIATSGRDESVIVVLSRLGGGRVLTIPVHVNRLDALRSLIQDLQDRYGCRKPLDYVDGPHEARRVL